MAEIRYEDSMLIDAERERVFDYRLDFSNLPQYNPNVSNLRIINKTADLGPGTEYLFDLHLPGADPLESPIRITTVERPSSFRYETGPGWMAEGQCTFEPQDNGTLVTLGYTLRFPGEIDDATAEQMASAGRGETTIELQNMKKILEG